MTTKEKILSMLEARRGQALSGEQIASELQLSRTAVWKAMKALERDGYDIEASTRNGYRLSVQSDLLSVQGIMPYLNHPEAARLIHVYPELESTNKTAKEMAVSGWKDDAVILAESQTAGRGRAGRSFFSPRGSGLYISFLLRPEKLPIRKITWITAVAALAVCDAIKLVTGRDAMIKWVNDVLLDRRKVCGILTEAITDIESGGIERLVAGIGINITADAFPPELQGIAGGLFAETPPEAVRCRLAGALINTFLSPELWPDEKELHRAYKSRQIVLGREITVHTQDDPYTARAVELDADGHLVIETPDGCRKTLSAGEVSVRL